MIITITGASGFLGTAMAEHLRARGHEVRETGRVRLGEACDFTGSECVIHAAHDFGPDSFERNRSGTQAWFDAARQAGVRHQVFLSSFSARPDSPSLYGRTKFATERIFLERGETVVRPGLVAGPGGMFAKFADQLGRWRIAPLVAADSRSIAVIALSDLLDAIGVILDRNSRGAFNLFAPRLLTGREFAGAVWSGLRTTGLAFNIPAGAAIAVLRIVRMRGALDSLRGQLSNAVPIHRSDLPQFIREPVDAFRAVELGARR